jgi:hypothetical protein
LVTSKRTSIAGTTRDVYLHIVTSEKPQGVREIWRALSLSSPSLAQYHINKLVELALIEPSPNGKYQVNEIERIDALRSFVLLRGRLIPRLMFYGALLVGLFLTYLVFWPIRLDFRDLVVIAISLTSITAFFYEAYNQYQGLIR